jgi:RNA polymerase sigma-70 factor (ECF subfamily)
MSEPDPTELQRLHEALVAGTDPTAPARMADLLLPALERRFARTQLPDPHSVSSLIGLSIARYLADPSRWQPERAPLLAFLWQDVSGDVKNERDSRARLRRHEEPDSVAVELVGADRNLDVEEEVLDEMDPFGVAPSRVALARDEIATFDERDRRLIALLGAGARSTSAYAEVLGIAHLPEVAQAKEVKRHKDRLKKRLGVIRGQLERAD